MPRTGLPDLEPCRPRSSIFHKYGTILGYDRASNGREQNKNHSIDAPGLSITSDDGLSGTSRLDTLLIRVRCANKAIARL